MTPSIVTPDPQKSMPRQQGLLRRGSRWYVNIKVPKDLNSVIGKEHIRQALGTSDYLLARRQVVFEVARWTAYFDEQRQSLAQLHPQRLAETPKPLVLVDDREACELTFKFFIRLEKRFTDWWRNHGNLSELDRNSVLETRISDAMALEAGEHASPPEDGSFTLTRFFAQEGLDCPPSSPAFKKLAPLFRAAELEHTVRAIDLLQGRTVVPRDPMFREQFAHTPLPEKKKELTLGELLVRYIKTLRDAGRSESTFMAYELPARLLREEFGERAPLSSITREKIEALCELLRKAPQNAAQRYPNMTLRAAVTAAEKAKDERRLKRNTMVNYVQNIGAIFRFAVDKGMLKENPASDRWLRQSFGAEEVSGPKAQFTIAELNRMFRAPVYAGGCELRKGRFWVPLLALFHGLRCNEACQLYTEDVKERSGISFLSIREELDDGSKSEKNLKTQQSRREVPLHPELLRLGFLEFVKGRRSDTKSPRLFPELKAGPKGYFSNPFSKWFARFVEKTLGSEVRATFHSFRHQFRDATREAGIPTEFVALLGGWEKGEGASATTMNHYGRGEKFLRLLADSIAKIKFTGLDLNHLYPKRELTRRRIVRRPRR